MYSSYNFDKFTETRSTRVVNLLGDMLMRKYPYFHENPAVPLDDLLEWELWPAYITIYGINTYMLAVYQPIIHLYYYLIHTLVHIYIHTAREASVMKEEGMGNWQLICTCALSILLNVCTKICNGDISMRDLLELHNRKGQMMKLCSATLVDGKRQSEMPSAGKVISSLEQRLREYGYFQVYLQQLNQLLSFLNSVRLQSKLCCMHEYKH